MTARVFPANSCPPNMALSFSTLSLAMPCSPKLFMWLIPSTIRRLPRSIPQITSSLTALALLKIKKNKVKYNAHFLVQSVQKVQTKIQLDECISNTYAPGVLNTGIPSSVIAATGTLFVPAPHLQNEQFRIWLRIHNNKNKIGSLLSPLKYLIPCVSLDRSPNFSPSNRSTSLGNLLWFKLVRTEENRVGIGCVFTVHLDRIYVTGKLRQSNGGNFVVALDLVFSRLVSFNVSVRFPLATTMFDLDIGKASGKLSCCSSSSSRAQSRELADTSAELRNGFGRENHFWLRNYDPDSRLTR